MGLSVTSSRQARNNKSVTALPTCRRQAHNNKAVTSLWACWRQVADKPTEMLRGSWWQFLPCCITLRYSNVKRPEDDKFATSVTEVMEIGHCSASQHCQKNHFFVWDQTVYAISTVLLETQQSFCEQSSLFRFPKSYINNLSSAVSRVMFTCTMTSCTRFEQFIKEYLTYWHKFPVHWQTEIFAEHFGVNDVILSQTVQNLSHAKLCAFFLDHPV